MLAVKSQLPNNLNRGIAMRLICLNANLAIAVFGVRFFRILFDGFLFQRGQTPLTTKHKM